MNLITLFLINLVQLLIMSQIISMSNTFWIQNKVHQFFSCWWTLFFIQLMILLIAWLVFWLVLQFQLNFIATNPVTIVYSKKQTKLFLLPSVKVPGSRSPPHVRVILMIASKYSTTHRITPACAGNTELWSLCLWSF